jgi:hypothetical protein
VSRQSLPDLESKTQENPANTAKNQLGSRLAFDGSETDAMTTTKDSWLVRLSQMDLWMVIGVFGTVLLLILPVPPLLLDLLLAVSIASSPCSGWPSMWRPLG